MLELSSLSRQTMRLSRNLSIPQTPMQTTGLKMRNNLKGDLQLLPGGETIKADEFDPKCQLSIKYQL